MTKENHENPQVMTVDAPGKIQTGDFPNETSIAT
jgi:hypothetical protein